MKYIITVEGETFEIEVGRGGRVWVNRRPLNVDFQGVDGLPQYSLLVDHRSYEAHIEQAEGEEWRMVVAGRPYRARLQQRRRRPKPDAARSRLPATEEVRAPLPGLLVAVPVVVGGKSWRSSGRMNANRNPLPQGTRPSRASTPPGIGARPVVSQRGNYGSESRHFARRWNRAGGRCRGSQGAPGRGRPVRPSLHF